jgi:hypothetical protein
VEHWTGYRRSGGTLDRLLGGRFLGLSGFYARGRA